MCNNFSNIKSVYKIIKDQSLIVEVYHGSFTVNEIIKFKLLVWKDENFNPDFNIIHDIRKATFLFEFNEINHYIDFLLNKKSNVGKRRSSMITSTPNQVAMSLGFDKLKKDLPININVCSTLENSFRFVGLKKTDWPSIEFHINKLKSQFIKITQNTYNSAT
jgi:hypothetical protein